MNKIMKLAMAVALLFAMSMNANAQFGGLKKLANKAKEVVTGESNETQNSTSSNYSSNDNSQSSSKNSSKPQDGYDEYGNPVRKAGESEEAFKFRCRRDFHKDNPGELEKLDVEEAGNMTNYFGITGGDSAVIIRYYELAPADLKTNLRGDEDGFWAAKMIVEAWRYIKNPAADTGYRDDPKTFKLNFIHNDIEKKDAKTIYHVKHAIQPFQNYKLMPKSDYDAFMRIIKHTVEAYEAKFGAIPR